MEFLRFGPDDSDGVAAYAEIVSAARSVDSPWLPPMTPKRAEGRLRHGWDGEVEIPYLAVVDGTAAAVGTVATSEYDNLQLAWLGLVVHPEHRRRGYGSATLEHLTRQSKALGRTMLGADGWEADSTRGFAARHGFEEKSRAIQRRQRLAEVDWSEIERLHAEAQAAASAYELVRREGRTPDEELEALAELTASINDAPTDDLEIEDEVFTADRVRAYEDAQLAKGDRLFRILARHRDTGELAGHTVVTVNGELPHMGDQHDTSVAAAHRGHRLGLLLKTDMNLWLREVQPQLTQISTFNAESNDHMIGVNEAIGYRIVGRELEFQRSL
jgi:GNAT superfamily N-acetyltransferase